MKFRPQLLLATTILTQLCNPLIAGPRLLSLQDPDATEIRAIAVKFLAAIAAGDRPAASALFAGPANEQAVLDAEIDFVVSSDGLCNSLVNRFGNKELAIKESLGHETFQRMSERARQELVVMNGDFACTAAWSTVNVGLLFRHFDGGWKVVRISSESFPTQVLLKFYASVSTLLDEARKKIDAGGYADAITAEQEVMQRMEVFMNDERRPAERLPIAFTRPATEPAVGAPDVRSLLDTLGKRLFSPEVAEIIDLFSGVPRPFIFNDAVFVNSYETGVSLSFHVPGGTLQSIHLFCEGKDCYHEYRGKLPYGLSFGMRRGDVERKLGRPDTAGPGIAFYSRLGLWVRYASHDPRDYRSPENPIVNLTLFPSIPDSLPPPPLPSGKQPWITFRPVVAEGSVEAAKAVRLPDPNDPTGKSTILLSDEVLFDENSVTGALVYEPSLNKQHVWQLGINLTPEAGRRMEAFTSANIGRRLALVLNGRVLVIATIRTKLSGHILIDAGPKGTEKEYQDLQYQIDNVLYSLSTTQPSGQQ